MAQMPETITFNVQPKRPWQIVLVVMGILLLVSLAGNWYQWDSNRDSVKWEERKTELAQQTIVMEIAKAQTAARRADSLQVAFNNRRTSDSVALRAVRIENKAMSETVQKRREVIQPLIDSLPDLRAFVIASDSLLMGKDKEIREMEQRHIGQVLDLQAILKEKTSQIMAQIAVSETLGQVVTNLEGEVKKEKRKKNFFKVVSGVLAGGIVFLSLKE